ncbi:MAG TPA: TonB-dependent receptor [Rhizomicrobium sp.]|jgi:iron complex outermembrane receptor protein|nr:TonB-dependent receptor [Rhizomicrobium sp.]
MKNRYRNGTALGQIFVNRHVLAMPFAVAAVLAGSMAAAYADETTGGIETVVVSAQRRSENSQKVPITIDAITANDAKIQGVTATTDLPQIAPGLVITPQFGNPVFYLRGVGTDDVSASSESSVATYVDGIYIADLPATLFGFNNVDHIEVLKGPQGTLFGRNATGGLIQIITKDPSADFHLDASIGFGNYNTFNGSAYVTGAITDNLVADLAVQAHDQGDGWGKNLFNGQDIYRDSNLAFRSKQLLVLDADTTITFSEDYSSIWTSLSAGRQPIPGAVTTGLTPNTGHFYDIDANFQPYDTYVGGGWSGKVEHDFGWAKLVSLSAARDNHTIIHEDLDSGTLDVFHTFQGYRNQQYSEELQLQSPEGQDLNWIGGLFYQNLHDSSAIRQSGTNFNAVGGIQYINGLQTTQSYAMYGQATYPIFKDTHVTAGVRYTEDNREFFGDQMTPTQGVFNLVRSDKGWAHWTWRAVLDHQLTDNVMLYVSANEGFKSGRFSLTAPTNPPARPEVLDAYEAGVKSTLLDNHLQVNLSGFYYNYNNIQLTTRLATGGSILFNAAQATIYGMDGQVLYAPIDGLLLRGNVELLHGRYDHFPNAPEQLPNPVSCVPTPHTTGAPTGANGTCTIDASGHTMVRAPDVAFDLGANYTWQTPEGPLTADVGYNYTSSFFFQPDNRLQQQAYGLLNATLNLTLADGRYEVRLWGKNITNVQYYSYLAESSGDLGTPGGPATYGATLELHL